ncbi:MAG TPA: hypothetical protein VM865_00900 [Acidobacteriaceae bacterium]|nr:hypothetical protein [Acidobacteriaceae bacterium]
MLLVTVVVGWLGAWYGVAMAQVTTTTIQDTVYRADGTVAGGSVVVSWPTFTTLAGAAVASGTSSATIGANGTLSITLAPNAGATPTGTYYTAVFHLNDGTTSRQYWVVPVSATPVKLGTVESQVLPTSLAMQTASRNYVDTAIAAALSSGTGTGTSTAYIQKTGDTMSGPLLLAADPVSGNQAADKNYVDNNVTAIAAGLGQKVSLMPSSAQVIAQPSGTQMQINALNGELYASQFQNGDGNNGISNALTSTACGTGCVLKVEPSYGPGEPVIQGQIPQAGRVVDARGGNETIVVVDPANRNGGLSTSLNLTQVSTRTDANASTTGSNGVGTSHVTQNLTNMALTGGSNQLPGNVENPPYGKATYGVTQDTGNYYTLGQHVQSTHNINCYGVGDCLAGGMFLTSSGGYRDMADEGAHPFDLQVTEDWRVFQGTCWSGCTTGSTAVMVNPTAGGGTQGEGRYLINKNPGKVITNGSLTGSGRDLFGRASFTGASFPVSVFLQTAAPATSQAKNVAPGTVTLPIATSNLPTGSFAATTAVLPHSGVACVADPVAAVLFPNFETANYTVVDATHISLTLNKVHISGATIAVGGLCGYGLEQTVDTNGQLRQVFPVVGSINSTTLYYADAITPLVANQEGSSTSAYQNITLQVASIARQGNVTTVTLTGNMPQDVNGLTFTVSGVADPSYNGSFKVTTTGANTLTYPNNGTDGTSSGGQLTFLTGGYVLYPMAEVLSVYDPANKQVDGLLTLAANTVAWASGDAVEEPHFYQQSTFADTEFVTQFMPRPVQYASAGKQYQGQVGPGVRGWSITNAVPASNYIGAGGTHQLPDNAYMAVGPWKTDFEVDAGTDALIHAHCNVHGCNRWNSGYSLFALDSAHGEDFLYYDPNGSSATWIMGGQTFTFSGGGFNANTINVANLSASALVSGYAGRAQLAAGGSSGYSNFTLNGNNADGSRIGFIGGGAGDANLYLDVPTGGGFHFRVNNVHAITFTGDGGGTVMTNVLQAGQVTGSGPAPSVGTGNGTGGGSASLSGTALSGVLTVTTGGAPNGSSVVANVGWSLPSSTVPQGCSLMPRNAAAAAATGTIYTGAPSASGWTVNVGSSSLAAGTTYAWSYQCM